MECPYPTLSPSDPLTCSGDGHECGGSVLSRGASFPWPHVLPSPSEPQHRIFNLDLNPCLSPQGSCGDTGGSWTIQGRWCPCPAILNLIPSSKSGLAHKVKSLRLWESDVYISGGWDVTQSPQCIETGPRMSSPVACVIHPQHRRLLESTHVHG